MTESKSSEFQAFDDLMGKLPEVPHRELKAKLDAEKRAKQLKRRLESPSVSRASTAKD
jgi:hypothetical protein